MQQPPRGGGAGGGLDRRGGGSDDTSPADEWLKQLHATCNRLSTQYLQLLRAAGSVDDGSIPIQLIIAALLLLSIMAMLVVARMYVCAML